MKIDFEPETKTIGSCPEKYIRWILDSHNSSFQFKFFVNESTKEVYVGRVDGQINTTETGNEIFAFSYFSMKLSQFLVLRGKKLVCVSVKVETYCVRMIQSELLISLEVCIVHLE